MSAPLTKVVSIIGEALVSWWESFLPGAARSVLLFSSA